MDCSKHKYYKVQYEGTAKTGIITVTKRLQKGRYYNSEKYGKFMVLSQARLKYNYNDIDGLIEILNDYPIGTEQFEFKKRLKSIMKSSAPVLRLSQLEKSMLCDIYYDDYNLSDSQVALLEKVLNIKEDAWNKNDKSVSKN